MDRYVKNGLDDGETGPYLQHVGRPRKFDTSQALAAVRDRFWDRGYAATSVDDLMTATGLGKGSLYGAFGDKRALFLRVLNEYTEKRLASFREQQRGAPRAIDALRSLLRPDCAPRGCFLVNCTYELAPHDAEVVAIARKTFAAFESLFADTVSRAVAEGDLPASTHPRELAATLLAVMQGQECLSRTGLSKAGLRGIAQTAALELLGGEDRPGTGKGTTVRERARQARGSHP
jgi:AcrR family transcriptional regulator